MQMQLPQIYYIIFTAITAAGVLLQAFVLLGMYLAIREAIKRMNQVTDEVKGQLVPVLTSSKRLIDDLSPKLKIASSNLVEVSQTLRHQTGHLNSTIDDVLNKTSAQAARLNEMMGAILNSVEHATEVLQHAATVPYRQVTGIMAGLKAGFDVLRRKDRHPDVVEEPPVVKVAEEVIP
jgi:methyl-accepting chemotaxis protein